MSVPQDGPQMEQKSQGDAMTTDWSSAAQPAELSENSNEVRGASSGHHAAREGCDSHMPCTPLHTRLWQGAWNAGMLPPHAPGALQ